MRHLIFVLALGVLGCSKPERVEAPPDAVAHYGDAWFAFRGESLGISVAAAQSRDAALPADHPPVLDHTTAVEAAAIYRSVCVACHGPGGQPPEKQPSGGAPPRAWGGGGVRMGFFFGGDSMRAGLFKKIQQGGDPKDGKPSDMPAWGSSLSREQTWALVRHFESF
jgi:mono/diheme cytochrome c family protein